MRRFLLLFLLIGTSASAQVVNPGNLSFDSADHALVDHYVVGYFTSATAAAPLQEGQLTKPGTCAPCQGALPSRPTAFGGYWAAVRAVARATDGTTVSSVWSNRVPFDRTPVAPVVLGLN